MCDAIEELPSLDWPEGHLLSSSLLLDVGGLRSLWILSATRQVGRKWSEKQLNTRERESHQAALLFHGFCFSSCLSFSPEFPMVDLETKWTLSSSSCFGHVYHSNRERTGTGEQVPWAEPGSSNNILFRVFLAGLSSLIYSTPEKYGQAVCLKASLMSSQQSLAMRNLTSGDSLQYCSEVLTWGVSNS